MGAGVREIGAGLTQNHDKLIEKKKNKSGKDLLLLKEIGV
jgi:hypothetical protein